MFKHTRLFFKIVCHELSFMCFLLAQACSVAMLAYFVYAIVAGSGVFAINIALCTVIAINFIVSVFMRSVEKRGLKEVKRWIQHTCRITKLCINAVSLAGIIYAVVSTPHLISKINLVLLPLMIILWVLQALLEMITLYIESRIEVFFDARYKDNALFRKAKRLVGTALGDEVEEEREISPRSERLFKRYAEEEPVVKKGWRWGRALHLFAHILPRRAGGKKL